MRISKWFAYSLVVLIMQCLSFARASEPLKCADVMKKSELKKLIREELNQHYSDSSVGLLQRIFIRRAAAKSLQMQERDLERAIVSYDPVLRFLSASKTVKNAEKPERWIQRTILERDLKSIIEDAGYEMNAPLSKWRKIFRNRGVMFLLNPFSAPYVLDKPISDELMGRVLTNGWEAEKAAIFAAYASSGQKGVDRYRQMARVYNIAAVGLVTYLAVNAYFDVEDGVRSAQKESLDMSLDQYEEIMQILADEIEAREKSGEINDIWITPKLQD